MIQIVTGHLPAIIITAALLTWPLSYVLLARYRRAVARSMRTHSGSRLPSPEGAAVAHPGAETSLIDTPLEIRWLGGDRRGMAPQRPGTPSPLARELARRPWRVALVYGLAGLGYAAAMTLAVLVGSGQTVLPIRFSTLTIIFAWPAVVAVILVAASTRRTKLAIVAAYVAAYAIIGAVVLSRSSRITAVELIELWVLHNGPSTVLFAWTLSRRIRAVGPLVLVFLILSLTGADFLTGLLGLGDTTMRLGIAIAAALGVGANGAFYGVALFGLLLFGLVGCAAVVVIGRRYKAKKISDESLMLDAMFVLFTIGHAVGLAFEGTGAVLAGAMALIVYKALARAGLAIVGVYPAPNPRLLLLRSFSVGRRAERLFDALDKHWRRVGSVQMIAGADLASRTIEPHEALDYVSGRLSRRFIDTSDTFRRRLHERDLAADRDGRFRVNDFFCFDDTWRMVLLGLVRESDAVLMDLRGFRRANTGCIFEIHHLFAHVSLDRVLFVVGDATDEALLVETFRAAAGAATQGNAGTWHPRVFRMTTLTPGTLRRLFHALADATGADVGPAAGRVEAGGASL